MSTPNDPLRQMIDAASQEAGAALGKAALRILTAAGKEVWSLAAGWLGAPSSVDAEAQDTPIPYAPYAIVGLGRCGSHVTLELAKLALPFAPPQPAGRGRWTSFLRSLVVADGAANVQPPKPMLIVGDIDEAGIEDISQGDNSIPDLHIKTLDYRPVAVGGVGNLPMLAEYYTRGLLNLSTAPKNAEQIRNWHDTRNYLVRMAQANRRPRLVFYVLSTGGGTGSGAAPEVLRTQRSALALSEGDAGMYFMGVAVMPQLGEGRPMPLDMRRRINTGRFLVRYLAELDIKPEQSYIDAPEYLYRYRTEVIRGDQRVNRTMRPWDCVLLVSNDLMGTGSSEPKPLDVAQAQENANLYIAQQVFSLAASQLRAQEAADGKENHSASGQQAVSPSKDLTKSLNFRSIRLDPADLLSALSGVCAVGFASISEQDISVAARLHEFLLRLVSPPRRTDDKLGTVEGISVLPAPYPEYYQELVGIDKALKDSKQAQTSTSETGVLALPNIAGFDKLAELPMFARCPRIVYVINCASNSEVPMSFIAAVEAFLMRLLPNVRDSRFAIVRQGRGLITMSLFLEGSVVLSPSVMTCVKNYLKLVWKGRGMTRAEFLSKWDSIVGASVMQKGPKSQEWLEAAKEWLGPSEQYGMEVTNYRHIAENAETNFRRWVGLLADDTCAGFLRNLSVADLDVSLEEACSALRFINYCANYKPPDTV